MSHPKPRRVTQEDDPELDVDYVTARYRDLGAPTTDRICQFTLRAGTICSHYLTLLPDNASDLRGVALKRYLLEHMTTAFHTRTCENVRR